MRAKPISDVLKEVTKVGNTNKQKVDILKANDHSGLRVFLELYFRSLDNEIEWLLPEGAPPYTPNQQLDADGALYRELKKLYLFQKGMGDHLTQKKRESIFIQLLETVTPQDAELLIMLKDKKKINGLNLKVVQEAFQ